MTSFAAESQRGQTTRCPGCGDLIRVPALLPEELQAAGPAEPEAPPVAGPPRATSQTPWLIAALIGGGCGLVGIVMILLAIALLLL